MQTPTEAPRAESPAALGFAPEAALHAAAARRRRRHFWQAARFALLIALCVTLLHRAASRMVDAARALPTSGEGKVVAYVFGVGLPEEVAFGTEAAIDASPWHDTSDLSWDEQTQHVQCSMKLNTQATLTLWSIPLGPQRLTLSVLVGGGKEVPESLQRRLAAKLVRDVIATRSTRSEQPSTLPDDVRHAVLTNHHWNHLNSSAMDPSKLSSVSSGISQVQRSAVDFRWVGIWCVVVVAPVVIIASLVRMLKSMRRGWNLRTGCERCGFPLRVCEHAEVFTFVRCSECGHDGMPTLLGKQAATSRSTQTDTNPQSPLDHSPA